MELLKICSIEIILLNKLHACQNNLVFRYSYLSEVLAFVYFMAKMLSSDSDFMEALGKMLKGVTVLSGTGGER